MDTQPNLLLILTDQHAATALSCRGHAHLHTPRLDRLAQEGLLCERAYCPYPVCVPSRVALLHGDHAAACLLPGTDTDLAGPRPGGPARGLRPGVAERQLAPQLRAAGYHCAYAGKWHLPTWGPTEHLPADAEQRYGWQPLAPLGDEGVVRACEQFLSRPHTQPFCLVASFDDPHNIHEWAVETALPQGPLPEAPGLRHLPPLPPNHRASHDEPQAISDYRRELDARLPRHDEEWRRYRWAYNRMVERVDARIGRVLDALAARADSDNTLVVMTSDHGDMQGAHQLGFKLVPYEEAIAVPLLLRGPGIPAGSRSPALTSAAFDVYATMLHAAGIAPPATCPGRDLRDVHQQVPWRDHLVIEMARRGSRARVVVSSEWKYVAYEQGPRREQFYHRPSDPGEQVDLASCAAYDSVIAQHREWLRQWCQRHDDGFGGGHYAHPERRLVLPGDAY